MGSFTSSTWPRAAAALATCCILAVPTAASARVEGGATTIPARAVSPLPATRSLGPVNRGAVAAADGPAWGTYRWPVRGEVIRPFEQPADPYSAGHRGIDIAAAFGTPIRSPSDGIVSFAGTVAGSLFISIDHTGGIRTSYSWVSAISVKKGQAVTVGAVIGKTGQGHPGSDRTHLHFSARLKGTYIDPMLLLGGGNLDDVIHLAPSDR